VPTAPQVRSAVVLQKLEKKERICLFYAFEFIFSGSGVPLSIDKTTPFCFK
jgi:hypothetical protein